MLDVKTLSQGLVVGCMSVTQMSHLPRTWPSAVQHMQELGAAEVLH